MGDVLLVYCFKYLHSRHNAEYTVIVTAVLYRVTVGSHYDTLCVGVCAGERCVDISNIIYLDLCAIAFIRLMNSLRAIIASGESE